MLPSSSARVPEQDYLSLDQLTDLPYLKHVQLTKYSPSHFGLEKWTRLFVIPDHWMRKIYSDEVWRDTDLPQPTTEKITNAQKKILYKWLTHHSPFKDDYQGAPSERKSRSKFSNCDDLVDLLDTPQEDEIETDKEDEEVPTDDTCDTTELLSGQEQLDITKESNHTKPQPSIPICFGHRVQPEYAIAQKAYDKMKYLSEEQENLFKNLLADGEYMDLLKESVRIYLEKQKFCSC